jgi:hypothetical protein
MSADTEWYWDLHRNKAVPASERGAFDHVLGPYKSREEAENWSAKVEERNEGWEEDGSRPGSTPASPTTTRLRPR